LDGPGGEEGDLVWQQLEEFVVVVVEHAVQRIDASLCLAFIRSRARPATLPG
jgi:hypothetical protein